VGTDLHTPNAAGIAMLGIGVCGSDAVDAIAGMPWELPCPKVFGVRLTGGLNGWASSKDIICKLAGLVSVNGGKGKIVEFFSPGVGKLGAIFMAVIGSMSAEIGATSCSFPYNGLISRYLRATKRSDITDAVSKNLYFLAVDKGSILYYDDVVKINLDELKPHINEPYTLDFVHSLSILGQVVQQNSWPENLLTSPVDSCINLFYKNLMKVFGLMEQADRTSLKSKTPFLSQLKANKFKQ